VNSLVRILILFLRLLIFILNLFSVGTDSWRLLLQGQCSLPEHTATTCESEGFNLMFIPTRCFSWLQQLSHFKLFLLVATKFTDTSDVNEVINLELFRTSVALVTAYFEIQFIPVKIKCEILYFIYAETLQFNRFPEYESFNVRIYHKIPWKLAWLGTWWKIHPMYKRNRFRFRGSTRYSSLIYYIALPLL
jgi:hypothetical protein